MRNTWGGSSLVYLTFILPALCTLDEGTWVSAWRGDKVSPLFWSCGG